MAIMNYPEDNIYELFVRRKYVNSGRMFACAAHSPCVKKEELKKMFASWKKNEEKYSKLGYMTIPLEKFIEINNNSCSLDDLVGKKVSENEPVVLYSEEYRKSNPSIN